MSLYLIHTFHLQQTSNSSSSIFNDCMLTYPLLHLLIFNEVYYIDCDLLIHPSNLKGLELFYVFLIFLIQYYKA